MEHKEKRKNIEESNISKAVLKQFKEKQLIDRKKIKSKADELINVLSLMFDLEFDESFEILIKEKYITKTLNRFDFSKNEELEKQIEEVNEVIGDFLTGKW